MDGAETQAFCAAIEADPGHAEACRKLGRLLQHKRKEVDGAEKAHRVAIEADLGVC